MRGDDAWIHLNDDAYMYKNVEEGAELGGYNSRHAGVDSRRGWPRRSRILGDYKHEGDIVGVAGAFNAACAQHGGDMDIHATSLSVVTRPAASVVDPVQLLEDVVARLVLVGRCSRRCGSRDRRMGHLESKAIGAASAPVGGSGRRLPAPRAAGIRLPMRPRV